MDELVPNMSEMLKLLRFGLAIVGSLDDGAGALAVAGTGGDGGGGAAGAVPTTSTKVSASASASRSAADSPLVEPAEEDETEEAGDGGV